VETILARAEMRDVDAWNEWRAENPKVKPDLAFAVMRGANLQLADLSWAQLREADLVLANLRGADLSTAEDLTEEQLRETRGDPLTKLPETLQAPMAWTRKENRRAQRKRAAYRGGH
jgi:uncharacterized protein YjbI with pentapeptide repeats